MFVSRLSLGEAAGPLRKVASVAVQAEASGDLQRPRAVTAVGSAPLSADCGVGRGDRTPAAARSAQTACGGAPPGRQRRRGQRPRATGRPASSPGPAAACHWRRPGWSGGLVGGIERAADERHGARHRSLYTDTRY